ncbi:MAG: alpha-2-macroglobulin family protein [Aureispira sp.]
MKLASSWLSLLSTLLLLWNTSACAQPKRNNYEQDWKAIQKLEQEGLTKSALEATQKLYTKMQENPNAPQKEAQLIKALLIMNKQQVQLEEDGLVKAIARLEKEAETAKFPINVVLYSMLGELYNNYLRQNVYKFRDRTATVDFDPIDMQTWDLSRITQKIYTLYQASLSNKNSQTIALDQFDPILTKGQYMEGLRPTLYDFLLHRALDFYRTDHYYLTQPSYKFYLDDPKDFAAVEGFINRPLTTKDSLSPKFQAMLLFQEGLKFHQGDKDPAAFMDLNLHRLRFVHQNSVLTDKDLLFEERLKVLYEQYKKSPIAASVAYDLAQLYHQQGEKYKRGAKDPNRWKTKKARELCSTIMEQFPKSYGASLCQSLRTQIDQKSISVQTEKIISIKEEGLANLSYKNVDRLYFKAVPTNDRARQKLDDLYGEEYLNYINTLSGAFTWEHKLPNEGDFQTHNTEIALPSLPGGRYVIVTSTDKKFRYNKNAFAYSNLYVSNLRLFQRDHEYKHQYCVINATTGAPVVNASIEFFVIKSNLIGRSYEQKIATQKSDKDGFFTNKILTEKVDGNSYYIKVTHGEDVLKLDDSYYTYRYNRNEAVTQSTSFFLDRAIYRPGQTIYFKGLVLEHTPSKKVPDLVTKSSRTVTLYDANYQKVADLELTSNDYGTFNGSFNAPTGGLLGQMRIQDENTGSSHYFKVEEYKRPKFEVAALPIKKAYKLGDSVTVKGQAKAYAGNNIDGAQVRYRVVRQVQFPYWNWRWGWYIPYRQEQQQMTFGETTTNDKGEYSVTFEAQPDRSIPADRRPSFTYYIYADVVDITGETHSAVSTVRVGYVALDLSINLPDLLEKSTADSLYISSRNLNGQFEAAKGTLVIEQLKTPKKVYKKRYWEKPDYYTLEQADFAKKFPYFAYKDEDQKETWAVEQTRVNTSFDTKKTPKVAYKDIKNWPQGTYKVVVKSQDKYGEKIELTKFFTLYDQNAKTTASNTALYAPQSFYNIEPDTTIAIQMGSADLAASILYEVEHDGKIVERRWVQPKGVQSINLEILEKHRGNLHFHLTSIQQGRFYTQTKTVHVPWSNKQLSIEYATFRNKLYPGQDETWTLKIKGPEGERVSAELLASMYDASLDAFAPNYWSSNFLTTTSPLLGLSGYYSFSTVQARVLSDEWNDSYNPLQRIYRQFDWHDFPFHMNNYYRSRRLEMSAIQEKSSSKRRSSPKKKEAKGGAPLMDSAVSYSADMEEAEDASIAANAPAGFVNEGSPTPEPAPEGNTGEDPAADLDEVKIRTNLNETVFFFPELKTDKEGNLLIQFKMNEALTRWKFQLFGHTKDMTSGYSTNTVVTQKDLMVVPNAPRFFREGDEIHFTAKVSNLTEKGMQGTAKLVLLDALTLEPLDAQFDLSNTVLDFDAKAGGSDALSWKIQVPNDWTRPLVHRVIAKSGSFSDGEESTLPVLTNRMLVTETQPLPIRGKQTKVFNFERMRKGSQSKTLIQHKLTLEFTQNPAWYAIQSLPYLMEYPYECTEQIFSRYYANSLASDVANSHPKIKRVFDQWKSIDTDALKSNLSKNEDLKYALLEETPWVLNAQSEEAQKKNIGILFDLNRMGNELTKAKKKIMERQASDGGFSWMPGGRSSWYITQYLVQGFGRLQQLGIDDFEQDVPMQNMLKKAVAYIDKAFAQNYTSLLKQAKRSEDEKEYLELNHLSPIVIHYFYARSLFVDQAVNNATTKKALVYFEGQAKTYWNTQSRYLQGMLALGLHRWDKEAATVQKIIAAARENALQNEEMGMYWKYPSGYYWHQLPIETHALMIELFDVVAKDEKVVEELKVWLLKAKQTTHWKTTKATAAACYALLKTGDNWLLEDQEIDITIGNNKLDQSKIKKEAGTGYFKTTWEGQEITPKMAKIKVSNPNKVVAWGALYWQYFENLDKITHFQKTPLKLDKKVFKKVTTDKGPVLKPVDKTTLVPGDLVTIRIELRVDRNMEYVHMKDMRAAGLEPTNVISQYKYQDGLGYYESTRDASTNFFFGYLSKGTYVFEYDLRVNHKGEFSNGVTTIQCMYAPEYTAHSEGIRITVE